MRERVPQPHPGAQIEDVLRRDPRLRQPADHQQLPQMPRVRPVGLRALLLAASAPRSRPARPDAPPRRPARAPRPRTATRSSPPARPPAPRPRTAPRTAAPRPGPPARPAPATTSPVIGVDPLRRDLRPMLIKPHHDRHHATSRSSTTPRRARRAGRPGRRIAYREPRSVPPIRMAGRAAAIRARLHTPFDAEDRPPSHPGHTPTGHDIFRRASGCWFATPGPVAAGCCLRAKRSSALDRRLAGRGSASCAPAWLCSKGQGRRWHASSARAGRGRWR